MPRFSIGFVTSWIVLVALGIAALPRSADAALQWRRVEQTIVSSQSYSGGNPYKDLTLRVRFTNGSVTFTQDAFFTGATASQFKVRTLLPAGTWSWTVAGCTGTTASKNCAGASWSPSFGSVTVSSTSGSHKLYNKGMVTQYPSSGGGYGSLRYSDNSAFFFGGDTAWAAPPREITNVLDTSSCSSIGACGDWVAYLNDRRAQGFTVALVAPAVTWDISPELPDASRSFEVVPGCSDSAPLPNNCSRPRREYWDLFDQLVSLANDRDLVVGILGMIDPLGVGSPTAGTYPRRSNAEDFARYLAARLAGNHVFFSPGFDTRVTDSAKGEPGGTSTTPIVSVMDSVGEAIEAAAPRHLIANHLAGRSDCSNYATFHGKSWLTFQLYQSGHAKSLRTNTGPCPPRNGTESSDDAAIRRAIQMPTTISGDSPSKPAINGEALYDPFPLSSDGANSRYQTRQAGYLTFLSDGDGYTYGTYDVWEWDDPMRTSDTRTQIASATDMKHLFARFRGRLPFISSRESWITNQPSDWVHRMAVASDGYSDVVAYLPDGSPSSLKISVPTALNTICSTSAPWIRKWVDPTTNASTTATCTKSGSVVTFVRPSCGSRSPCDWVLDVQNSGFSF